MWFALLFSIMKTRWMVLVAFIGATFLACDTQPPEAIDTSESPLASESAPEAPTYDPAYLDDLTDRVVDVTIDVILAMSPEESEQVMAGDLSFQEAADMTDSEMQDYVLTMEELRMEADAVLSDDGWHDALHTPYVYKNSKLSCGQRFRICILPALFMSAVPPIVIVGAGVLGSGTLTCVCMFCKGEWRDKICLDEDEKDKT